MKRSLIIVLALSLMLTGVVSQAAAQDAGQIVQQAVDYLRGKTSVTKTKLTIHRPDWSRDMELKVWTKGKYETILHIIKPDSDFGNGILKKKDLMWTYNPKINRVLRVPPSMMSQSYMGSDFSNNDLSKNEDVLNQYHHTLLGEATQDGKKVYMIESVPKHDAAVVYGMIKLHVREDHIFVKEEFFDQDLQPVKTLTVDKIAMVGGKNYPVQATMKQAARPDHYTVETVQEITFDKSLSDSLFTIANLQNPKP